MQTFDSINKNIAIGLIQVLAKIIIKVIFFSKVYKTMQTGEASFLCDVVFVRVSTVHIVSRKAPNRIFLEKLH